MAHILKEPYSGKNPVPQIATKLTALVNPERATEAKAAQLQDQSRRDDQKQTEKRASRLAKGYVMHVMDPVTGEELDIKNADEEPDTRNKGENVLNNDYPEIGTHHTYLVSHPFLTLISHRLGQTQGTCHVRIEDGHIIRCWGLQHHLRLSAPIPRLINHKSPCLNYSIILRVLPIVQDSMHREDGLLLQGVACRTSARA